MVPGGAFKYAVREITENAKAVRESRRHPQLSRSVGCKFDGGMLTKPGNVGPHVDHDVENLSVQDG